MAVYLPTEDAVIPWHTMKYYRKCFKIRLQLFLTTPQPSASLGARRNGARGRALDCIYYLGSSHHLLRRLFAAILARPKKKIPFHTPLSSFISYLFPSLLFFCW